MIIQVVNGNYGEWSSWSLCSKTCGEGEKNRDRECNNPEPQFGGLECSEQPELGSNREAVTCNLGPCPRDGMFCSWGSWSNCDKVCGPGFSKRLRECKCPAPEFGGRDCDGSSEEKNHCYSTDCPVDGNYTSWSAWSPCSRTCGNGTSVRARKCDNPSPKFGGNDCSIIGPSTDFKACYNNIECPIDGGWSMWSEWSLCSQSCGDGVRTRNRSCTDPGPQYSGRECVGLPKDSDYCKISECCPIQYKSLGCFKDPGMEPRPIPDVMFTDRDPQSTSYSGKPLQHGKEFQNYVGDLICRCAKTSKNKGFTHFSIQDFGECLSGPNAGNTYNYYGEEQRFIFRPQKRKWYGCMDYDHQRCPAASLTCVGMEDTNYVYGIENVPPIDGNYSPWSNWTECSRTCGVGIHSRNRNCTNPKPMYGGKNCSLLGPAEETAGCQNQFCPIPGNWGEWNEWTACFPTTGKGTRQRIRKCDTPVPQNGGDICPGNSTEFENCESSVPQHCGWSEWTQWSQCDRTCGIGSQERSRSANNPPKKNGGNDCIGESHKVKECVNRNECPVNGGYTEWGQWEACSKDCGGGLKQRRRNCTAPIPRNGGLNCTFQGLGSAFDEKECNVQCCPVHGALSEWSAWEQCDVSCGSGYRRHTRMCDSPQPTCGGRNCTLLGELSEQEICAAAIQCPEPGGWTPFGNWSTCSKTCGYGGVQTRNRSCTNPPPRFNGPSCVGSDTEVKNCSEERSCCDMQYRHIGCFVDNSTSKSMKAFPELIFNRQDSMDLNNWDEFLDETVCLCAKAAKEANYPYFAIRSLGECHSGPSTGDMYKEYGLSENCVTIGGNPAKNLYEQCLTSAGKPCAGGDETNYVYGLEVVPINGNYSEWSKWTDCSVNCGRGERTRYRTCTNPSPKFGGLNCFEQQIGEEMESDVCIMNACPIHCNYTQWSDWSGCSVTCGNGFKERIRSEKPSASFGGENCSGDARQSTPCEQDACPVDGNYTEWFTWSAWSATCGNVTRVRYRYCTNPVPKHGGKKCDVLGVAQETEFGNLGPCPVPGGWCTWSPWSLCSRTCGIGFINRTRTCSCPPPIGGGVHCAGTTEECRNCNITGCPVDGKYTTWSEWSVCSQSCGNATRSRSRVCNFPLPAFGGQTCVAQGLGESEDTQQCVQLPACRVDGGWSPWGDWSNCSMSCGEGRKIRTRACTNPSPNESGLPCPGNGTETQLCKNEECCAIPHEAVGCFRDMTINSTAFDLKLYEDLRPFSEQLKWEDFLPKLICDCAAYAIEKRFTYFGINNFRECWSGEKSENYFSQGVSNQCISRIPTVIPENVNSNVSSNPSFTTFESCKTDSLQCAGMIVSIYVFKLGEGTVVPEDGNYTEWSSWSECSKTCGPGHRTSSRNCSQPWPGFGGSDCSKLGESFKVEECQIEPCPTQGTWSQWSEWTPCPASCGIGYVQRERQCVEPINSYCQMRNGEFSSNEIDTQGCRAVECPVPAVDDDFPWSDWGPCSVSCGGGVKSRVRNCSKSIGTNKVCPCPSTETIICSTYPCPINGNWGAWSSSTECSTTCGNGVRNRTRLCDSPVAQFNGIDCEGQSFETVACPTNPPCPVNGNYSDWSDWSPCSATCGNGTSMRVRACNNPTPKNGGLTCLQQDLGPANESLFCEIEECPVNCVLSAWTAWTECNVTCGNGKMTRYRYPDPDAKNNGTECVGDRNVTSNCYKECCSIEYERIGCFQDKHETSRPFPVQLFDDREPARKHYADWDSYLPQLACKCAEVAKRQLFTHFGLSDLGICFSGPGVAQTYNIDGASSDCVAKLPVVQKNNTYQQCQADDVHCAGARENSVFVYGLENIVPRDCGYSVWSSWSNCSQACGTGLMERSREKESPPAAFGGLPCTEDTDDTKECQIKPCPVNGAWSAWSDSGCSVTCGSGVILRTRKCNNPSQLNDGLPCPGNATENKTCNESPCPIDGGWTQWSQWTQCSQSCDQGKQSRFRTCTKPPAANGGKQCTGAGEESKGCEKEKCKYPPGPWQEWSECSQTCGTGRKQRVRYCDKQPCYGDLEQFETCQLPVCPKRCNQKTDLGYLVDFSGSIDDEAFKAMRAFINTVSSYYNLTYRHSQFSYLPYHNSPQIDKATWFNDTIADALESNDDAKIYIESKVREPEKSKDGSYSYMNRGLMAVSDTMFNKSSGMRDGVSYVLIVLSDGKQDELIPNVYPNEKTLQEAANDVKAKGVVVITVAAGKDINYSNLQKVATSSANVLNVTDINNLNYLTGKILKLGCQKPEPYWGNWGAWTSCSVTCDDGIMNRHRQCIGGNIGEGRCQPKYESTEESPCNLGDCPKVKTCTNAIDVGFVVDLSGSTELGTEDEQFEAIKKLIIDIMGMFDVYSAGTHFAYIPFSSTPGDYSLDQWFNNTKVRNMKSQDKTALQEYLNRVIQKDKQINNIARVNPPKMDISITRTPAIEEGQFEKVIVFVGGSFLNRALELADRKMFSKEYGLRTDNKKVMVLYTDGVEDFYTPDDFQTDVYLNKIKEKNVEVVVLAVGNKLKMESLKSYAENDSFIYNATTFDLLKIRLNDIVENICYVEPHWGEWSEWGACSQSCGGGIRSRSRQCEEGSIGEGKCVPASDATATEECNKNPCFEKCNGVVDLGILADYSESVDSENITNFVKELMDDLANVFVFSSVSSHFAFIPFHTFADINITGQWFSDWNAIQGGDLAGVQKQFDKVIREPIKPAGSRYTDDKKTYTFRAMNETDVLMFSTEKGMRLDKKKILIIISDGKELIRTDETDQSLSNIRRKGVEVVAIGVGKDINQVRLQNYTQFANNVFQGSDFESIKKKFVDIFNIICQGSGQSSTTEPTEPPPPVGPFHCSKPLDIVIVIDGSGSTQNIWEELLGFLHELVNEYFEVGDNSAMFAIVMYSDKVETKLRFDGFAAKNKNVLLRLIQNLAYMGGETRIDLALDHTYTDILEKGLAGRSDAPDVILLLTDGITDKTNDSKDLSVASLPLKEMGTRIVTVGLGTDPSREELLKMADGEDAVFMIRDLDKIMEYVETVAKAMCTGIEKTVPPANLYNSKTIPTNGQLSLILQQQNQQTAPEPHESMHRYSCEPTMFFSFDLYSESNIVYDESGRGNNGIASSDVKFDDMTKKCNKKMSIESEKHFMWMSGERIQNKPVDEITIAVWLNLLGNGKIHPIFSVVNQAGQNQYVFEIKPDSSIHFAIKYKEQVVCDATTVDNVFKFEEWTHVAVTYSVLTDKVSFFVNGRLLPSNKVRNQLKRASELLPADWSRFVGIAKEQNVDKQLMGSVDEFYLFPCALSEEEIRKLKDFCGRYEPRPRVFTGVIYELFLLPNPSSTSFADLEEELQSKEPVDSKQMLITENPAFDTSLKAVNNIGTGAFAARLSGYFIPPLEAEYILTLEANARAALYMNAERVSLPSEVKSKATLDTKSNAVQSTEYKVSLQAGKRYYFVLYQLSHNKNNVLRLGFEVKSGSRTILSENPITNSHLIYDIPNNCSIIRSKLTSPRNDEYTIRVHPKCNPVNLFCYNMEKPYTKAPALEYVTLARGTECNYAKYHRSRLVRYETCSGEEIREPNETTKYWGQTWFKRVRLNIANMLLVRGDFTFAYSLKGGNLEKFGSAGDCYSESKVDCRRGQFKINFNGTGMKLVGNLTWVAKGYPKDNQRITQFNNEKDQVLSANCGGSCSECQPTGGRITLMPDQCLAGAKPLVKNEISKKTIKREKRSWWSFLW